MFSSHDTLASLTNLSNLTHLDLQSDINWSTSIIPPLSQFPKLETFRISGNGTSQAIFAKFDSPTLRSFDLSDYHTARRCQLSQYLKMKKSICISLIVIRSQWELPNVTDVRLFNVGAIHNLEYAFRNSAAISRLTLEYCGRMEETWSFLTTLLHLSELSILVFHLK